jgi:hypothetical protein
VAKKKTSEVAIMDENMFAADAGIGVSDLGSEDLAIPFLKVLQKMSDELDDLADAKAGDIYNTVTKDVVKGKVGVTVINCAYVLQFIEWEPRGTGTGAPYRIYSSSDEIPQTERGDDNKDYVVGGSGRYLERTAQHYVLIIDEDGMTQQALLPMKSTQFKKSKQWNSAMRSLKMKDSNGSLFTPPRFSHVWNLDHRSGRKQERFMARLADLQGQRGLRPVRLRGSQAVRRVHPCRAGESQTRQGKTKKPPPDEDTPF